MRGPLQLRKVNRGTRLSRRDFTAERACGMKRGYIHWVDAETEVLRLIAMNIETGRAWKSARLGVYKCEFCKRWHVGHSRGPEAPGTPSARSTAKNWSRDE